VANSKHTGHSKARRIRSETVAISDGGCNVGEDDDNDDKDALVVAATSSELDLRDAPTVSSLDTDVVIGSASNRARQSIIDPMLLLLLLTTITVIYRR